ncbi:rCG22688 [Rattus norvegicus]|uniref:RCG22688 n=1 Tax=Rattus norvegicus TaxID=10116 RepID=A6KNS3_RAT|nr:rCG22688 [Rattus norvegicus]
MVDTSGYGLLKHLRKLSDGEFWSFKELLRKEPEKFKLKPISWMKIENASKEELVMLLNTHYPKQAWDMALSLFLQVNREDLSIMAQKKRRYKQTKYKKFMKTTFQSIWTLESNICIPDRSYHLIVEHQYRKLQNIFDSESEPVTAVVTGPTGEGKTVFLRKAMLDWASGILWQNRFQYVFFFSVLSLNNTTELSLAELISSKLPESSETLNDILSDPKKILFILDGFDYLKFDLELRTNLCNDWRKILPTQIILSSLLQKIMLPESSLLLELGHISLPKIFPLLQYPRDITIQGFSERCLKTYFISFFNTEKGIEVFENLKSNQMLKLCSNPYLCWMFCSCLKWQFDREEEAYFQAKTDSVFFTSFMVSAFKSAYASNPPKQNRAQLKSLCTLAVEGMWKQLFVFDSEDLRRNGISESDKAVWLRMKFLQNHDNHIVFYHPTLQLYFASMFYFLKQDKDTHVPVIGSIPQLLRKIYARDHTQWLQIGIFLFGLATEQVASLLKPYFGFIQHRDVRQEVMRYLKSLSQRECCEKLERPQNLFACLRDNKEEKFVREVVDLFEEITVDITNSHVLSIIANHLQKSSKLKKLHLHIQKRVFLEIHDPEYSDSETFTQDKKLGKCDISSEACGIIATSLMNSKVKHLSLVENPLKNKGVMSLCEMLKDPSCVLETLMLSYCCLTFIACGHLYEALVSNKHLSLLDLGSNFLEDTGVNLLCEALKDPNCILKELWLDLCKFTSDCCEDLASALTTCKTLNSLNLDWKTLEHSGVVALCEALNHKKCNLKMLG